MKTFFEIAVDCVEKSRSSEMLINAISKALLEAYDKGREGGLKDGYNKGYLDHYEEVISTFSAGTLNNS